MIGEFVKTADWKMEKHVPVIDCAQRMRPNEPFSVVVTVGRDIPHPNEPGHHIDWIALHYVPEGSSTSVELARCAFSAHGAGSGLASGVVKTSATMTVQVAVEKPGKLIATAYCNIHGLWSSECPLV